MENDEGEGFDQGLPPRATDRLAWGGRAILTGVAGRHWFWVMTALLSWRGLLIVLADHADDNRYVMITYAMLYITYMILQFLDDGGAH